MKHNESTLHNAAKTERLESPPKPEKPRADQSLLALVVQHLDVAEDRAPGRGHREAMLPPSATGTLEPSGDGDTPEIDQMIIRFGGNGF